MSNFAFNLLPPGHIIFGLMSKTLNYRWDHFFHLPAFFPQYAEAQLGRQELIYTQW